MEEQFEYELIEILFETEEAPITHPQMVCDDTEFLYGPIEYDEQGIPKGKSLEEIREREKILSQFLHKWSESQSGERKIHNINLNEDIFIIGKSVAEIIQHSAKRYLSTLAVFHLEEVISQALPVRRVATKLGNSKQAEFSHMLLMVYQKEGFGSIKVTVGVRFRKPKVAPDVLPKKIEYGITVLEEGEPLVNPKLDERIQKKRKASHKK